VTVAVAVVVAVVAHVVVGSGVEVERDTGGRVHAAAVADDALAAPE
jgi:hypothetical protein